MTGKYQFKSAIVASSVAAIVATVVSASFTQSAWSQANAPPIKIQAPITEEQTTAPETEPQGKTFSVGNMVFPIATARTGALEPVPVWQRNAVASWLILQVILLTVCAVALNRSLAEEIRRHPGHLINPRHR